MGSVVTLSKDQIPASWDGALQALMELSLLRTMPQSGELGRCIILAPHARLGLGLCENAVQRTYE